MNDVRGDQSGLASPRDYLSRANDFYCACRDLPQFSPNYMPLWPQHALFAHAIELVLKGYLLSRRDERKLLKKYGHRLPELFLRAIELGLQSNDRVFRMITSIDEPYSTHVARYPDPKTAWDPIALVEQFYSDYDQLLVSVEEAMSSSQR